MRKISPVAYKRMKTYNLMFVQDLLLSPRQVTQAKEMDINFKLYL